MSFIAFRVLKCILKSKKSEVKAFHCWVIVLDRYSKEICFAIWRTRQKEAKKKIYIEICVLSTTYDNLLVQIFHFHIPACNILDLCYLEMKYICTGMFLCTETSVVHSWCIPVLKSVSKSYVQCQCQFRVFRALISDTLKYFKDNFIYRLRVLTCINLW